MEAGGGGKHFVLVHGLCLGPWSWYKVTTALESASHRVTALDHAASGAHPARLHKVRSFEDYSRPLLDAVAAAPDGDRLVLVGHSHGGASLALAMERFPRKVAAAVFVWPPCCRASASTWALSSRRYTNTRTCTNHCFKFQVTITNIYIEFDFFFFFCDERSS